MRRFLALALALLAGPALADTITATATVTAGQKARLAKKLAEDAAVRSVPFRLTSVSSGCFHVDKRGQVVEEGCRFVASGDSATPGAIHFSDPIAQCHNFKWSGGLLVCADGPVDPSRLSLTWEEHFPELHKPDDQPQDCIDQLWDVVRSSIEVLSGRRLSIKGALARAAEVCQ